MPSRGQRLRDSKREAACREFELKIPTASARERRTARRAAEAEAQRDEEPAGFAPSCQFEGARHGFVFKRGPAGLGYYPDTAAPAPAPPAGGAAAGEDRPDANCHYAVLGVERDATEAQIRAAYRRRALELHPDRQAADEEGVATERFQRLQASYQLLSDAHERAWFDRNREAILAAAAGGPAPPRSVPAAAGGSSRDALAEEEPEEMQLCLEAEYVFMCPN